MKNNKKIIYICIAILLAIGVGVLLFFVLKKDPKQKEEQLESMPDSILASVILDDNNVPIYIAGSKLESTVKDKSDVFALMDEVKDAYGYKKAKDVFEIIGENSSKEMTYYKLQQVDRDIPVYGYQLVVAVDKNNKVTSITGNYANKLSYSTYSSKSIDSVKESILDRIDSENKKVLNEEKIVYVHNEKTYYAYKFDMIDDIDGKYTLFVDANTGKVINKSIKSDESYDYTTTYNDTIVLEEESNLLGNKYKFYDSSRNIKLFDSSSVGLDLGVEENVNWYNAILFYIYDSTNHKPLSVDMKDGKLSYWFNNEDNSAFLNGAVKTYANMEKTYDYVKSILGRNSYDDKGGEIKIYQDIKNNAIFGVEGWQNACWSGDGDFFIGSVNGTSYGVSLDVIGHEFTHGIVEYTAGLEYESESGALNESYADIIGSMIEGKNFILAEDVEELRSMIDPNVHKQPKEKGGDYYFPEDTNYYNDTWVDNAKASYKKKHGTDLDDWKELDHKGVHTNSGVPNHAAYLIYKNAGLSMDEIAILYYNSLFLLGANSTFEESAIAVLETAKNLGYSEDKLKIIKNAFVETKMLEAEVYELKGTVTDKESKEPIQNVIVTAVNKLNPYAIFETVTDDKGNYVFKELESNEYTIVFEKAKYKSNEKDITLDKNSVVDITLEFTDKDYADSEVVFVMDISGSMTENDPGDIRKQIIINILSSMDNNSSAALVLFTKSARTVNDGLNNSSVGKKMLISDIFDIVNDNGHQEDSGTNGRSGINKALGLFTSKKDTRKYIVFLTDGMDNDYNTKEPTYDELVKTANSKGVKIISIGLSDNCDSANLELIANGTSGKYYQANESSDLSKFDKKIFDEIK